MGHGQGQAEAAPSPQNPWEPRFRGWLPRCWSSSGRWPASARPPRRRIARPTRRRQSARTRLRPGRRCRSVPFRAPHQRSSPPPHRQPRRSPHPSRGRRRHRCQRRRHGRRRRRRHGQRRARPHGRPHGRRRSRPRRRRPRVRWHRAPCRVQARRQSEERGQRGSTRVARAEPQGSLPCSSPRVLAEASSCWLPSDAGRPTFSRSRPRSPSRRPSRRVPPPGRLHRRPSGLRPSLSSHRCLAGFAPPSGQPASNRTTSRPQDPSERGWHSPLQETRSPSGCSCVMTSCSSSTGRTKPWESRKASSTPETRSRSSSGMTSGPVFRRRAVERAGFPR
jgi:hypothetical protein